MQFFREINTHMPFLWFLAVAVILLLIFSFISFKHFPTPTEILKIAPPRSFLRQDHMVSTRNSCRINQNELALSRSVTKAIIQVLEDHLRDGSQLGVSISVFFKGREIANVCGGLFQSLLSNEFQPVTPDTLFMAYRCESIDIQDSIRYTKTYFQMLRVPLSEPPLRSVAKGIAAATVMALVDQGADIADLNNIVANGFC